MIGFARQVYALLAKDLLLEARTKDALGAMLVFSLLILLTFNVALDLQPEVVAAAGPGVLWVAVLFGSTLGLGRTFTRERDQGTLDGLLMAPVGGSAVFLAKLLAHTLMMGVVLLVTVPAYAALFRGTIDPGPMALILAFGTIGLGAVGTLLSAVAANTRAREVMLPILLFPIIVPLLIGVVQATGPALGAPPFRSMPWISLLVALDATYIALGILVFDYVLEE